MKPVTFEQFAHDHLYNNGVFEDQVTQIIERAKKSDEMEAMKDMWDSAMEGYPPVLKGVFLLSLDRIAVGWIDENCPKAWFRGCFVR